MKSISREQWIAVGKGAVIAGAGAVLTYLSAWVAAADFGTLTPIVAAGFSVLVNLARQWNIAVTTKEANAPQ